MKVLYISFTVLFVIVFTGCFNQDDKETQKEEKKRAEQKELIACNSTEVKNLVWNISKEDFITELTCLKQVEENSSSDTSPFIIAGAINMCKSILMTGVIENEKLNKMYENTKNQILLGSFDLIDTRTIAKDTELSKVECKATLLVTLFDTKEEYNKEVHYIAQLSDDKKKVFIEIKTEE